tara:strand:- start:329 stop:451 length:123 start_codon:yes stop_codon:yes gene_type:complete
MKFVSLLVGAGAFALFFFSPKNAGLDIPGGSWELSGRIPG